MATKPVDPDDVKAFYEKWVAAGRPGIAEFARQSGRDRGATWRWLVKYAAELGLAADDQRAALQGFAPDQDMTHPAAATATTSAARCSCCATACLRCRSLPTARWCGLRAAVPSSRASRRARFSV